MQELTHTNPPTSHHLSITQDASQEFQGAPRRAYQWAPPQCH